MPSIQLFAFEVDTHDGAALDAMLRAQGIDRDTMTEEAFFRTLADLQGTLIARHVPQGLPDDVLPVFLAPEFYFKAQGGTPFSRTAFFNSLPYLAGLSRDRPDVLWFAGTVWWAEPHDTQQMMVHNSALILQNGSLLHSWQKERLSGIDGLNQGPEIWDRHDPEAERILEDSQDPIFTATLPDGSTLDCGIEVCLDHRTLTRNGGTVLLPGVLRQHYLATHPPGQGAGVDLHVLIAAGMPMQGENVTSRDGGVFLRCDGGQGARPRSEAYAIDRPGPTPEAALRQWQPQTFAPACNRIPLMPQGALACHATIALN